MDIQWYPGHMTKTRRMISDNLKMVDAVCEILDARIPVSSRNYDIAELSKDKPRLIVLNRVDLADDAKTKEWASYYRSKGYSVLETNSKNGGGVSAFPSAIKQLLAKKLESYREKGQVGRSVRIMICGVPNVGKSSFINRVSGRNIAKAEDRPGVTRDKQWIRVGNGIEVLDTPGMLWPKFDDKRTALNLAFTGAIKDDILDIETLASLFMEVLSERYAGNLNARYKITCNTEEPGYDILERAGKSRGFLISGGEVNTERMAKTLLDEFRAGALGKITLESVDEADRAPLEKIELRGMLLE